MIKKVITYHVECECCNKYFDSNELTYVHVRKHGTNDWTENVFMICDCCRNNRLFGKWKYCEGIPVQKLFKKYKE